MSSHGAICPCPNCRPPGGWLWLLPAAAAIAVVVIAAAWARREWPVFAHAAEPVAIAVAVIVAVFGGVALSRSLVVRLRRPIADDPARAVSPTAGRTAPRFSRERAS